MEGVDSEKVLRGLEDNKDMTQVDRHGYWSRINHKNRSHGLKVECGPSEQARLLQSNQNLVGMEQAILVRRWMARAHHC